MSKQVNNSSVKSLDSPVHLVLQMFSKERVSGAHLLGRVQINLNLPGIFFMGAEPLSLQRYYVTVWLIQLVFTPACLVKNVIEFRQG